MTGLTKKILIALLAATCLTAGAVGLSACGGKENDSALYALYLAETDNGATKTYEQWLKDKFATPSDGQTPYIGANGNWWIGETDTGVKAAGESGEDGRGIDSIKTIGGEFIVFYTDGTYELVEEADDLPFKLLKVTAKDQTNAPVANVYLQLTYYDTKRYRNEQVATASTNSEGVVKFLYVPEEGINYRVALDDHGETEYDPNLPDGYEVNYPYDSVLQMPISYFAVEDGGSALQTVTIPLTDVSHSFANALIHNNIVEIPYTRTYDATAAGNVKETNGTAGNAFKVNVKAGYHTYLSFLSFVSPEMTENDDGENDLRLKNATAAATGKYKFTVSGGTDPVLYFYEGNVGSMPSDERGIPTSIIYHTGAASDASDTAATDTNYITLNNDATAVRGTVFFGLYSDSDCKVTISVERVGEAEEIPTPQLVEVPAPTNLTKWSNKAAGETLTLMPITGAYTAVLGGDGYYHVNSASGPIINVMLTKPVSRYLNDLSLKEYPTNEKNELGAAVLHFNPTDINEYFNKDNRYPLKKYDYNKVLAEYCKFVNSDGVYGVDETLYAMLGGLANMAVGVEFAEAAKGYQWLLPCYYYEPSGGITAPGSGTTSDPYVLNLGKSSISLTGLNGTATLKLSVSAPGVYALNTSATLAVSGFVANDGALGLSASDCPTYKNGKVLYVRVPAAGDVTLTLTGVAASYSVETSECGTKEVFVGDASTSSQGVDAETAISIVGTGIYNVVDNKSANDGVYIKFSCDVGGAGEYVLTVYGDSGATITYGTTTAQSVTVNAETDTSLIGKPYVIYVKASSSTNLMLVITKQS